MVYRGVNSAINLTPRTLRRVEETWGAGQNKPCDDADQDKTKGGVWEALTFNSQ